MNHMIDLTAYLPSSQEQAKVMRHQARYERIVAALEGILTLAISIGFFFMLFAFFCAL